MAINISQAFHRTSANPIDDTLALTKAEMLTVNDNLMPSKYLTVCQDDGQIYLYDKNATPSAETGKFSLLEAGGGSIEGSYLKKFENVLMNPQPTSWKNLYDNFSTILSNLINSIPDDEMWIVSSIGISAIGDCRLYKSVSLTKNTTVVTMDMSRYWVDSTTDTSHWQIRLTTSSTSRIYKTREHVSGTSISIEDYTSNTNAWSIVNSYFTVTKYKLVSGDNAGHQYSTNEQVVGTWVDGKPVYEKTAITSAPAALNTNKSLMDIPNAKDLISMDGFVTLDNNSQVPLNSTTNNNPSQSGVCTFFNYTTSQIFMQLAYSRAVNQPVRVTARYTKTTD